MADEKFVNIANFRLEKAIKYIRMVARMSGSRTYELEAEDVEKITERLNREVARIQTAFDGRTKKAKDEIEQVL